MKKVILPVIRNIMPGITVNDIFSGKNIVLEDIIQISKLEFECFLYGNPEVCDWLNETNHKYTVVKKV